MVQFKIGHVYSCDKITLTVPLKVDLDLIFLYWLGEAKRYLEQQTNLLLDVCKDRDSENLKTS